MDNAALDAQPKTLYVSGLLIDWDMQQFLLINKNHMKLKDGTVLKWQGIGGHNLPKEHPNDAMVREFYEETNHYIAKKRWHCYHIKDYGITKIYFFAAFCSPSEFLDVKDKHSKIPSEKSEGDIQTHSLVDVYFDPNSYTFDLPYLINIIQREMKMGMFMKFDPEGINTSGKNT